MWDRVRWAWDGREALHFGVEEDEEAAAGSARELLDEDDKEGSVEGWEEFKAVVASEEPDNSTDRILSAEVESIEGEVRIADDEQLISNTNSRGD